MTLLITFILIHAFDLPTFMYVGAFLVWIVHLIYHN